MQNTQVSETKEFRRSYSMMCESKNELESITKSVMCYRGAVVAPNLWKDVDPGYYLFGFKTTKYYLIASPDNYTKLCTIEADLSHLPLPLQPSSGKGNFYKVKCNIVLLFGLTEFKAVIAWKEDVGHLMVHWINFY